MPRSFPALIDPADAGIVVPEITDAYGGTPEQQREADAQREALNRGEDVPGLDED